MPKKLNQKEVIEKFEKIHKKYYNYTKVKYLNSHTKVEIICPKHGSFTQLPYTHWNGGHCAKCAIPRIGINRRKDKYSLIRDFNKIHENIYEYCIEGYKNNNSKIKIFCKIHGLFEQSASNHLSGQKCPKCAHINRVLLHTHDIYIFKEKAMIKHADIYDYSKSNYVNSYTQLEIICKKHGSFWQKPGDHIDSGAGCPKCAKHISKAEVHIANFIKSLKHDVLTSKRNIIKPYELDIYIPSLSKAIEFNGTYWHYSKKYFKPGKHSYKSNLCREKGIKLLHIREDLWLKNQEKMKQVIIKFLSK